MNAPSEREVKEIVCGVCGNIHKVYTFKSPPHIKVVFCEEENRLYEVNLTNKTE